MDLKIALLTRRMPVSIHCKPEYRSRPLSYQNHLTRNGCKFTQET